MQRVVGGTETRAALVKSHDELAVVGALSGPVDVAGTLWVNFKGTASGPLTVRAGGRILVDGVLAGPVTVERGGHVIITGTGSSFGPLTNHGSVRVAGAIGNLLSGLPPVFVGTGRILEGDVKPDGMPSYGSAR